MKDGANQEIEVEKFVILTGQNTARMELGFIIGFTNSSVKIMEQWNYRGKHINKTPERLIVVPDELAKSMDEKFFNKMRNKIEEQ